MAKSVFFFGDGHAEGDPKRRDLLGGKGAGLAEMTSLGLPVPPGFTIATDVCNAFAGSQSMPDETRAEVAAALTRLESVDGGAPRRRLRAAARERALGRARLDARDDGHHPEPRPERRGRRGAGRADEEPALRVRRVPPLRRDARDHRPRRLEGALRPGARRGARPRWRSRRASIGRASTPRSSSAASPTRTFRPTSCGRWSVRFKAIVKKETGKDFPSDPRQQLWQAIEAVFKSWNNHRAIVYRRMHDIPDDWGTACNVQAMVFGNLGDTSATGVAFTRDPSTGEKKLYGEWLPNAQGEDVVAGIRTPLPLRRRGPRRRTSRSRRRCPTPTASSSRIATTLEKHFRDMQDLEFTIQDGKLYMLQCRNGEARGAGGGARRGRHGEGGAHHERRGRAARRPRRPRPAPSPDARSRGRPRSSSRAASPASPGAASGHIVFSADEAERRAGQGKPVILVRVETSPEDIHGMKAARGILTARGGMTSHAAVVARGMGKPCVAGVSAVAVNYETQTMTVTVYDDAGQPDRERHAQEGRHHHDRRRQRARLRGRGPDGERGAERRVRRAHVVGRRGAHA